jgi:hypothetical protein
VIVVAVRWYLRHGLSYHDVEQLLAERGIEVDHVHGRRLLVERVITASARSRKWSPNSAARARPDTSDSPAGGPRATRPARPAQHRASAAR